jgi:aspartate carbamoyltransferase catalytic subunit
MRVKTIDGPPKFQMKHVLESQQYDTESLKELFGQTDIVAKLWSTYSGRRWLHRQLEDKTALIVFTEPSTRTRISFERACKALGMDCIIADNAKQTSSMVKGEKNGHMNSVLNEYDCDLVIIRQEINGLVREAAEIFDRNNTHVINAGDGTAQHPTQALLDTFSIDKHFGRLSDLNVLIGGDLERGRTVHSLCYLLAKYPGNKITFASPKELAIPQNIMDYLLRHDVKVEVCNKNWRTIKKRFDVAYWTRVQSERSSTPEMRTLLETLSKDYIFEVRDLDILAGPNSILMHPLPIKDEIVSEVDDDPRAIYLRRQIKNGLFIRIAILCDLFDVNLKRQGDKRSKH